MQRNYNSFEHRRTWTVGDIGHGQCSLRGSPWRALQLPEQRMVLRPRPRAARLHYLRSGGPMPRLAAPPGTLPGLSTGHSRRCPAPRRQPLRYGRLKQALLPAIGEIGCHPMPAGAVTRHAPGVFWPAGSCRWEDRRSRHRDGTRSSPKLQPASRPESAPASRTHPRLRNRACPGNRPEADETSERGRPGIDQPVHLPG